MNLCPFFLLGNYFFLLFYNNSLHIKDNPLLYVANVFPVFICLLILLKVYDVQKSFSCSDVVKVNFFLLFSAFEGPPKNMTFKISFYRTDSVLGMAIGIKRKTIIWPSFTITQLPKRGRTHSCPVRSGDKHSWPHCLKILSLGIKNRLQWLRDESNAKCTFDPCFWINLGKL